MKELKIKLPLPKHKPKSMVERLMYFKHNIAPLLITLVFYKCITEKEMEQIEYDGIKN